MIAGPVATEGQSTRTRNPADEQRLRQEDSEAATPRPTIRAIYDRLISILDKSEGNTTPMPLATPIQARPQGTIPGRRQVKATHDPRQLRPTLAKMGKMTAHCA